MNHSTSSSKPLSLIVKKPGLLNDECTMVVDDCHKFMQCKTYGNITLKKSFCECSDGYKPSQDRLCSK